jgi:hypothetical protein
VASLVHLRASGHHPTTVHQFFLIVDHLIQLLRGFLLKIINVVLWGRDDSINFDHVAIFPRIHAPVTSWPSPLAMHRSCCIFVHQSSTHEEKFPMRLQLSSIILFSCKLIDMRRPGVKQCQWRVDVCNFNSRALLARSFHTYTADHWVNLSLPHTARRRTFSIYVPYVILQ